MSEENYIEALEETVKMSKSSMGIFGIPLALLLSQFRFLAAIDSVLISLLATVSAIIFFLGTIIAFDLNNRTHFLLAKEKLMLGGNSVGKGFQYLEYIEEFLEKSNIEISESALVEQASILMNPLKYLIYFGYSSIVLLLIIVVWTPPAA